MKQSVYFSYVYGRFQVSLRLCGFNLFVQHGRSALIIAAIMGHADIAKDLVVAGADIFVKQNVNT